MKLKLRNYQETNVTDIRGQLMAGMDKILYVLPTGGGKTVVFSYITEQAAKKGNRVCILVHRSELVDQSSDELKKLGVDHGIISAGKSMDLTKSVQVASVQTLVRRLNKVPADFFQLIIVDEAHHAVAGSWDKTTKHFSKAKILGVTATPQRLDGRPLGSHFQAMVIGPDCSWLTLKKFLSPARIFAPPRKVNTKQMKSRAGDWAMEDAEKEMMHGDFMGDAVTHYGRHIAPHSAIAFCCTIAHAQAVAQAFRENGVRAECLAGKLDKKKRKETIEKLGTGEIQVLTSCQIISEGTDVPSVTGAILLRPTKSLSLYLQQVGRCLRVADGKDHAIIMDHVGNSLLHGLPTDERKWSLEGKKKRTVKTAPLKVCQSCYAVNAINAKVCSTCGEPFIIEEREYKRIKGDLVERIFRQNDAVEYLNDDGEWEKDWLIENKQVLRYDEDFKNKDDVYTIRRKWGNRKLGNETLFDFNKKDRLVDIPFFRLRPSLKMEMSEARTFEELKELAKQRGYKVGWAYHVWNQRKQKNVRGYFR